MAKFLTPLITTKVGPQLWELYTDFVFLSDKYPGLFIAPKGFVTNFASIPRIFWRIFPPVDNYDPAAVIHDAGYNHKLVTEHGERIHTVKPIADRLFYEALMVCGTGRIKSKIMYELVTKFGKPDPTPWLNRS